MTVFEAARQADCIQAAERLGLQLKRSGSRRFTRCLFHAENTPSMCLYPDAGGFYCFGCHEHGDAIRLYQQALGIDALEGAKRICADFGLSYDQHNRKMKQKPLPYKPPALNVHALAKKLMDWREDQVQKLLKAERTAEAQMERIESHCISAGKDIADSLEAPEWETAFQQKCNVQEHIAILDSLSLPELLSQMKEETHGEK